MTAREEFAEAREQCLKQEEQRRTILELLKGGCTLFGRRVEIAFPDGQPFGKSNAELADMFDPEARA